MRGRESDRQREDRKRRKALKTIADAAVNGNLIVKGEDGRTVDTSQTKHIERRFASSQEMYSFIYDILHTKGLIRPEVNVFNPHPTDFRGGYLFPRDMFLVREGAAIMKADQKSLHDAFSSVFQKFGAPAVQIVAGYDADDIKRVNIMLFPQLLKANCVDLSFSGGFSEQEIEKIIKV